MLKILVVVDKVNTALDRLAQGVKPYHNNLDYSVVDVHPKRPSDEQLSRFEQLASQADVIEYQYFRTAEMLRNHFDWLKDIPSILVHNNPYSINESDWNSYDMVIGSNKSIFAELGSITTSKVEYVPLTVDHTFWKFNQDYKADRSVIMVANRIESKKGILPVAIACAEIGAKLHLVGSVSDVNYMNAIEATGNVKFYEQIEDEGLRELYYQSGIHVCNSIDNFESGTLPILEAAFCGVPILTRMVGHVPDLYDGEQFVINEKDSEDVLHLTKLLDEMFGDKARLEALRQRAWQSVKGNNHERRAYYYQQLYRQVLFEDVSVSIVMPIADNPDITRRTLESIVNQDYQNIELILIDDGKKLQNEYIAEYAATVPFPLRYLTTSPKSGYNLAQARNLGIIEATGDLILFLDQRMVMEPDAISEFVKQAKPRHWLYGNKGGGKKDFVENFSCIYRSDIVQMGMFNERITEYGGMSQECRSRARKQGIQTSYIESAKATPSRKSSNKFRKKDEIIRMKNFLWKVGLE